LNGGITIFLGVLLLNSGLSLLLLTLLSSEIIGFSLHELIECGLKCCELIPESADLDESLFWKKGISWFSEKYRLGPRLFESIPTSDATKLVGRTVLKS